MESDAKHPPKQHQQTTMAPGMRGGNGYIQPKNGGKSINSSMQTKIPTSTVPPITFLPGSATASPPFITSTTNLTSKLNDKQAAEITEDTTRITGSSEHKRKCSREEEEPESSNKTISASTDLQKSFQKTSPPVIRTVLPTNVQVEYTLKGSDCTLQETSTSSFFPPDTSQFSPGATTISASQVKETAGKRHAQESACQRDQRKESQEGTEGKETMVEKRGGQKRNEQERKKETETSKSFRDAATMTEKNLVDAALQTELLYEDAGVQAVVEVSNKSTSPNITRLLSDQMDGEKVSGSANMSFQNGQDLVLDSGSSPTSAESKVKGPIPTPDKTSKPSRQHVCQIQIELCSQAALSSSPALLEKKGSPASSPIPGLEKEPEDANRNVERAAAQLPEVAWDEQGMTWEVYGAAVDMESLGFAIQNHLQRRIQEHEQRIRHLRKSISLSEHSDGEGKPEPKTKKKSKVFQSLFQRPTCCLRAEA